MVGREEMLANMTKQIRDAIEKKQASFFFIRGKVGSGKSLFVRKVLSTFAKEELATKKKWLFVSFQTPLMNYINFNGWVKILKEMLKELDNKIKFEDRHRKSFNLGDNTVTYKADVIGDLINDCNCFSAVKLIEKILGMSIQNHFQIEGKQEIFDKFFKVVEPENTDHFFKKMDLGSFENTISTFFCELIKTYIKKMDLNKLVIVIEDSHQIDIVPI